jgi:hypothetical protein
LAAHTEQSGDNPQWFVAGTECRLAELDNGLKAGDAWAKILGSSSWVVFG